MIIIAAWFDALLCSVLLLVTLNATDAITQLKSGLGTVGVTGLTVIAFDAAASVDATLFSTEDESVPQGETSLSRQELHGLSVGVHLDLPTSRNWHYLFAEVITVLVVALGVACQIGTVYALI